MSFFFNDLSDLLKIGADLWLGAGLLKAITKWGRNAPISPLGSPNEFLNEEGPLSYYSLLSAPLNGSLTTIPFEVTLLAPSPVQISRRRVFEDFTVFNRPL
jgi:hypothetical protein